MRKMAIALVMGLAACSGELQPGPMGKEVDLRQYLPETLRSPETKPDTTYHYAIVVGPDSARVELAWAAFRNGQGRYLATVSARLVKPVHYDSISLAPVSELKNVGSKFEAIESAKLGVNWYKTRFFRHRSGMTPFRFDASGTRTVWPAMGQ